MEQGLIFTVVQLQALQPFLPEEPECVWSQILQAFDTSVTAWALNTQNHVQFLPVKAVLSERLREVGLHVKLVESVVVCVKSVFFFVVDFQNMS